MLKSNLHLAKPTWGRHRRHTLGLIAGDKRLQFPQIEDMDQWHSRPHVWNLNTSLQLEVECLRANRGTPPFPYYLLSHCRVVVFVELHLTRGRWMSIVKMSFLWCKSLQPWQKVQEVPYEHKPGTVKPCGCQALHWKSMTNTHCIEKIQVHTPIRRAKTS